MCLDASTMYPDASIMYPDTVEPCHLLQPVSAVQIKLHETKPIHIKIFLTDRFSLDTVIHSWTLWELLHMFSFLFFFLRTQRWTFSPDTMKTLSERPSLLLFTLFPSKSRMFPDKSVCKVSAEHDRVRSVEI